MSKTTKIIAALGVVAGLGVAALPAFTYAAEVAGSADVYVEVEPAIAMTITGNNDGIDPSTAPYPTAGTDGFGGIAPTGATEVGSFTADMVNAGNSSSYIKLLPNALVHGDDTNGFKSNITVYTNNGAGYHLGIAGTGASDALGALAQSGSGAPTIAATGIVKAGVAGWGYAVNTPVSTESDGTTPNYLTAANTSIDSSSTKTLNGKLTKVYYGVSTAADQDTGVYQATVTYTATTN